MLKVNFDVSGLRGPQLTGIANYTKNLISTFQKESELQLSGTYRLSRFKYRNDIKKFLKLDNISPLLPLFSNKIDVFHGTDFWVPNFGTFKKVVTIHDLTFYHEDLYDTNFTKYFQQRLENMLKIAKPDHIIVVSDFIKNEFLERFPAFENQVSTIYHGADHFERQEMDLKPMYDFPYIATIGMISKRKNIENLCKSFALLEQTFPDLKLIICGASGTEGTEIIKKIKENKLAKNIIFTGHISDEVAFNTIKNAQMLVFPSLYEGFGFPILEAMSLGVPVVCSDFGAMKEISGNAALCANVTNIEVFSEAMKSILSNNTLKNDLIQKGIQRFKKFTWQQCAKETHLVYSNL